MIDAFPLLRGFDIELLQQIMQQSEPEEEIMMRLWLKFQEILSSIVSHNTADVHRIIQIR